MGTQTSVRLIRQTLAIDAHLFQRCQHTCYFRTARNFRRTSQNGIPRCQFLGWSVKSCFNNFHQTVCTYANRIKSTKLHCIRKKSTLFMWAIHANIINTKCNQLFQKYSFFIWTCSLILPFQVVLWHNFSHIKDYMYNQVLQYGGCEALTPSISSADSVVPTTSLKSNRFLFQVSAFWCSLQEFWLLNLRAIYLLCVFSPLLLAYPLTYVSTSFFILWLRLLYVSVEYSGATFVKLGQWASTRRDLFSKEFCDQFSGLHHKVRPHTWSHTVKALRQAYGENWQQILHLSNRQEPIGSGCIAQVYKGYISTEFVPLAIMQTLEMETNKVFFEKDIATRSDDAGSSEDTSGKVGSGEKVFPVAIKVLHPTIRKMFHRDLKLMKAASKFLTFLFPKLHWVNLNQCVEEFAVTMNRQLDMRYEFQCLEKFTEDFKSFPNVKVPQPIPVFVRQNVLVESFEDGVSVSQILRSKDHSLELKKELAALGLDVLLQMVFVNNFVHADLHPGNLLVQNIEHHIVKKSLMIHADALDAMMVDICPVEEPSLKLVLLDCGITASLSPEDRLKFTEVFTAIVRGEGEIVADLFLSKSPVNQCTEPEVFRKEMAQLVTSGCQNLMSVSKIKVAELMNDLFTVLSRHKIQLESSFATIILAIAMLEGLGRTLDPTLNLMERARPVLLEGYLRKKY